MNEIIWEKIEKNVELTATDAIELLNIDNKSGDFYRLIAYSNARSRAVYNNRGYVFAQIGINTAPCSGNCGFCSMAKNHYSVDSQSEKDLSEIIAQAEELAGSGIDALFLMTTADYDFCKFVDIGKKVRDVISHDIALVANTGDFDADGAKRLKDAGFTGAYHIVRLREGIDTAITPETRIKTLNAIRAAGLELYYCVEPIGPEHRYDELAAEMARAREYGVDVMAVMRRVGVAGTQLGGGVSVSEVEMTKIAAVTRLFVDPKKSMNIHEPMAMPMLAGVNQLYAEYGGNPRDGAAATERSRGFSMEAVKKMLGEAEYDIK